MHHQACGQRRIRPSARIHAALVDTYPARKPARLSDSLDRCRSLAVERTLWASCISIALRHIISLIQNIINIATPMTNLASNKKAVTTKLLLTVGDVIEVEVEVDNS